MFRKSFVKTAATLALGMTIGSATLAAAAPSTVQAVLAKFSFSVDGQVKTLKNYPLVYNGTTYLPVREVAGMLDADVTSFDNKTKKIEIQTKESVSTGTVTTPGTTPTTPTEPQVEKTYSIGDTIETLNFKIKANSVTYADSYPNQFPKSDETLVVMKFDVFVTTEPSYQTKWYATDFLDDVTLENGKELMGQSFSPDKININQWNTVTVVKTISKGDKVKELKFSDPIKRDGTYYTVKVN